MAKLTLDADRFLMDGKPFDMWGIRAASGTMDQAQTDHLIAQFDDYLAHGVNAVAVYYMGCSGGWYDPFSPDGKTLDSGHRARMRQIAQACADRQMVLVVGIFYQRAPFGLQNEEAVIHAVRSATESVRGFENVIINIVNEQNSNNWEKKKDVFDFQDPEGVIRLCRVVKETDGNRLVGGGGYDHDKNVVIGKSDDVDVLLFDTCGPEDSTELYDRFVAEGVVDKPIVNVELFGGWSKTDQVGVFPDEMKAEYLREIKAGASRGGLSVFLHSNSWCQDEGNRYDLAGDGTADDPGIRWYFEAVAKARGLR